MAATSNSPRKRATSTPVDASASANAPALIDALPIACAIFDADGNAVLASNHRFRAAFQDVADLSHFHAQFDNLESTEAMSAGTSREGFHRTSRRWYELWTSPVEHLGAPATLLSAADISERQRALSAHKTQHEKLLFTSRTMSVGEMATTLAHELNQPLAAIINYVSVGLRLLGREGADVERIGEAMRHARAQAEHASQVITRLREFVRAREPRREDYAPADLVATVLRLLALEAEKHDVRVNVDVPADLAHVHADRIMIEQVLLNLAKNGIEAMREAPREQRDLDVRAMRNFDDQIEFRIGDRGCGLSDSAAEQVFTPFFTTKADGMGIGLAICRSIVEYHEGRLYFERKPGGGSVFVFTLPAAVE